MSCLQKHFQLKFLSSTSMGPSQANSYLFAYLGTFFIHQLKYSGFSTLLPQQNEKEPFEAFLIIKKKSVIQFLFLSEIEFR
jgi:hypothetical protein